MEISKTPNGFLIFYISNVCETFSEQSLSLVWVFISLLVPVSKKYQTRWLIVKNQLTIHRQSYIETNRNIHTHKTPNQILGSKILNFLQLSESEIRTHSGITELQNRCKQSHTTSAWLLWPQVVFLEIFSTSESTLYFITLCLFSEILK